MNTMDPEVRERLANDDDAAFEPLRAAKITVTVKPGARVPSVRKNGDRLVIAVREPAVENRANEAVRRALAQHLGVAPSRVRLARGATSRTKIFEIE